MAKSVLEWFRVFPEGFKGCHQQADIFVFDTIADLISQAELYAEEAGLALGILAVLAGSIWWLRRQTDGHT